MLPKERRHFGSNLINGKHIDDSGGGIVQKRSVKSHCGRVYIIANVGKPQDQLGFKLFPLIPNDGPLFPFVLMSAFTLISPEALRWKWKNPSGFLR